MRHRNVQAGFPKEEMVLLTKKMGILRGPREIPLRRSGPLK